MSSLAEIRARLAAQENKSNQNTERSQGDSALFPFWNMAEGDTASVRFLPDADSTNPYFWVEKAMIKLPFTGVKGKSDSKNYLVQVPCMEIWGENCPILQEVRTWYKDESLKETANKYWKKRTYLFQGFVRQNPLSDDKTPENPIRRFTITPQIYSVINASLRDPEIEELPTDYLRGLDFKIVKSSKGGYADYSTSGFARKETALSADEMAAIEQHGLFNLKDYLPKKPTDAEQRIIREMFEASVDGRPYDADKWAAYYKPWGLDVGTSGGSSESTESAPRIQVPVSAPVAKTPVAETAPWEADAEEAAESLKPAAAPAPATPSSDKANDILAMIRSRQKTA
jgi:hypothetical protein